MARFTCCRDTGHVEPETGIFGTQAREHLLHNALKERNKNEEKDQKKTYNTRDSLVVTDPTTSLALRGLCTGERTGPSAFHELWSYVPITRSSLVYVWILTGVHVSRRMLTDLARGMAPGRATVI